MNDLDNIILEDLTDFIIEKYEINPDQFESMAESKKDSPEKQEAQRIVDSYIISRFYDFADDNNAPFETFDGFEEYVNKLIFENVFVYPFAWEV